MSAGSPVDGCLGTSRRSMPRALAAGDGGVNVDGSVPPPRLADTPKMKGLCHRNYHALGILGDGPAMAAARPCGVETVAVVVG